ncbi:MAG: bifunctional diguanylate cyclase/phosphodiesterase [Gemmatimonadaceae bacterium]
MPRTRDIHSILEQLLATTGAKHVFIAKRAGDGRPRARVVSRLGREMSLVPDSFGLESAPWTMVSDSGDFWCSTTDAAPRLTARGEFAAILGFETSTKSDKLLVLVHEDPAASAAIIEPCMRLVGNHLAHVWTFTPDSTPVVSAGTIKSRSIDLRDSMLRSATVSAAQAYMARRLDAAVAEARASQQSTHVLLAIDLDGFTAIDASYGQDASARLLEAVGGRLQSCLKEGDVIARYGCDEFCVLVRCTGEKPLMETVSERLQQQLSAPFRVESHDIGISASVGIARVLPEHETGADVRRDAYAAVHHAKIFGGNQCALFDDEMHAKTRAKLRLEAELRHAIDRGEFRLHYQPIVSTETGRLASLEALLRWEHPVRGCLPPSEFLEALTAAGLMTDVGRWIMREACRQTVEWRTTCKLEAAISINVSPRQLLEPGFVHDLMTNLEESGAQPSWIDIEITEDLALGDGEAAMDVLLAIRDCGVNVRIDDFGTGYSSLSYLQQLPVSGLKIDRAFIEHLDLDQHRREIVGAIIRLAHVLGLDVVAEGVERQAQLDALLALGCNFVQGYHISRPQAAAKITSWMQR